MKQEIKWFDRKFYFDHLNGSFPSIFERLDGLIVRLDHKLESIPVDHLHIQLAGKWSIKEHIGHLLDLESLWTARMKDFINGEEALHPADLENTKTHEANHNAVSIQILVANLKTERSILLTKCKVLADVAESKTALHPRLRQPMRVIDLAYFVAEHDDHHLAAISEISAQLNIMK
jgi:uncharacterized damage-inducible protein DinB